MWKVMVADDELYMLEAMEKLFNWEKMGCQLIFNATNGKELLERMEKELPDIVITDVRMPLVSGIDVAKYIYEKELPTKVIILSAYEDFEYAREAIQYDVCGYIVKTSVIEMLPQVLQKTIKKLPKPVTEMETEEKKHSNDILERLKKYISLHYTEKLTLEQIANDIHANGSYLSRVYKVKTGQNLFDAINKMKLKKAKEYMAKGHKIYEVAQLVGFDDVSYFSRVFKKYEGCSPREYEKRYYD